MPRILLVEDNEMNRDMLSRRLERKGYQVLLGVDGERGVEIARAEMPDLVLMDMSLPVLDGWEATRRLKAAPDTRHIPVIALTAHAMSGDHGKALDAGCDDYDTKPIELPRLLAKIVRCWAAPRVRPPPRRNRPGERATPMTAPEIFSVS
jgi:two-component system, cell cycle response regulator DivK